MLVEKPRWKHGNIAFLDPAEPVTIRNGREHYLIHWDYPHYNDEYVDCSYVHKMEDFSKSKRTRISPEEVWVSPEQRTALKGLRKSRALGRRLFEESSSPRWRTVEEDGTLELSIDPFAEVPPEETLQAAQKRSPKPLLQERLRLQAAQKRSPKPPPKERLQAVEERSLQVGKEDIQASKPLPEGRKKSPALQEKSKLSSQRRRLIMEEDDEMFPCNIDPFSEELVYRFEAQDENEAAESDQSLQENCF